MRIAFISNESFPTGMSTTNRILSLSKGLVLNGDTNVDIFCIRPTEKIINPINTKRIGKINSKISFIYTNKSITWPEKKLKKLWVTIVGIIKFLFLLLIMHKKRHYDFVINTTTEILPSFIFRILCSFMRIKLLLTVDEFPRVVRYPQNYNKLFSSFYLKYFYRVYDGLIIMTTPLIEYFEKSHIKKSCKIVHIPMTVEPERFDCKSKGDIKYIAYCGNLGQNDKDGVPVLIHSFALIEKKHPDFRLYIIGDAIASQQNEVSKLKSLVGELGIKDKVVFTGKIHRDEMPKYLCNAHILALSRPDNIQAKGGFPTKLGEYLSTGKPVVVTKVGEIPNYLVHNKNIFFSKPDSIESFSKQLEFVINNYEYAKKVGNEGKKIANSTFSYSYQGKRLYNYLLGYK